MEPREIKQLRKRLGWSLADFGRYFGVTAQAVLKWERGTAQPNDLTLAAMIQLQHRVDSLGEQQKQDFLDGLRKALLTGGMVALLAYLFNQPD